MSKFASAQDSREAMLTEIATLRAQVASLSLPSSGDGRDAERHFSPEFEVWQDDMMVASACGPREDAYAEAMRYAEQYGQDGPVRVFEVQRTLMVKKGQP